MQLLRPDGSLEWQRDLPLALNQVGETATVRYGIALPLEAPSGRYVLQLAVYDPVSGQRETAKATDLDRGEDVFILSKPIVE